MNNFEKALDNYITGHYGEDQFKNEKPDCKHDCAPCEHFDTTDDTCHKDMCHAPKCFDKPVTECQECGKPMCANHIVGVNELAVEPGELGNKEYICQGCAYEIKAPLDTSKPTESTPPCKP